MSFQLCASVVIAVCRLTMKGWTFVWERGVLIANHEDVGIKKFDNIDVFLKFITEKGYDISK